MLWTSENSQKDGRRKVSLRFGCLPSANNIRQEPSQRTCPEVHHSKDGSQVSSLVGREAKLGSQVRCQGVVNGQLHDQETVISTTTDGLLQQVQCKMRCRMRKNMSFSKHIQLVLVAQN